VKPTPDICRRLVEVGNLADDDVDLADTALLLGSIDRPGVNLGPYQRHLSVLGSDVANYLGGLDEEPELEERAAALAQILHRRYGYSGTEEAFHDPEGANLTRVIDCRSGLPVTIGILYLLTARAQGWRADGLDFPGRFLVRLEQDGERIITDPFSGGLILSTQDLRDMLKAFSGNHAELKPRHYETMSARKILIRLQGNIRGRLLREDRLDDAVQVIETMLLFAPKEARLWRECGLLHSRLDNVPEAIAALEEHLKLGDNMDVRYGTSVLLQELRQRLS
jgi:regulator of sirC expression with transglutaminase-like and TPR domain